MNWQIASEVLWRVSALRASLDDMQRMKENNILVERYACVVM